MHFLTERTPPRVRALSTAPGPLLDLALRFRFGDAVFRIPAPPSEAMRQSDTSPDAARVQLEILRKMTGEQRIKIAFKLTDFMRRAALSRIRSEHPDWSEWQVKRELLRIAFLPDPLPAGLP